MARTPNRSRRTARRHLAVGAFALAALVASLLPAQPAQAFETGLSEVGPGSVLTITRADGTFGCTGAFLFRTNSTTYLGTAGHCIDGASRVQVCANNCVFGAFTNIVNHLVTPLVDLCGGTSGVSCSNLKVLGNSGSTNDFGLIPIPSGVATRAEVPTWGGPTGTTTATTGDAVCLYGNGAVLGETIATKGRVGVAITSSNPNRWLAHGPAVLGDSGGPVVDCDTGAAVGLQTHVGCTPSLGEAAAMCGTTISKAVALGKAATDSSFRLVTVP